MDARPQKWPNTFVLVRHGESVFNDERERINRGSLRYYTDNVKKVRDIDSPLTAKGRAQAKAAGRFLKKEYGDFDAIFVSPARRAMETGGIIAKRFPGARIVVEERLREKEFGIADGLTPEELKRKYPDEYERKAREGKYYYRPSGGESYPDVNLRVWSFLTTIVREYSRKDVLVVSHYTVMLGFRKLLEKFGEKEILAVSTADKLKNCGIIGYRYNPDLQPKPKLQLEFYNKTG